MSVCVSVPILWKSYFRPGSGFTHGREVRKQNRGTGNLLPFLPREGPAK